MPVPFRSAFFVDRNQQLDLILVYFDIIPGPLDRLHPLVLLVLLFEGAAMAVGFAFGVDPVIRPHHPDPEPISCETSMLMVPRSKTASKRCRNCASDPFRRPPT